MAITKIPALIKMGKEGLKGDLKRLAEIKKEFEKYIKVKLKQDYDFLEILRFLDLQIGPQNH